jgi:succinate dehydrogenase / fumarate reductase membrane anchor subunit
MSVQGQGFRAWLLQRISAVYIGIYLVVASVCIMINIDNVSYVQWQQMLSTPFINISLLLFFYAIFLHTWIGSRDIIIDYVKPVSMRLVLLAAIALGIIVMLLWVSLILLSVLQL